MKPYGYSRRSKLSCRYGCCQFNNGRKHPANNKPHRKSARQESVRNIFTDLIETYK